MASIQDFLRSKLDKFKASVSSPRREPLDVVSNNPAVLNSARARQTLPQTQQLIQQARDSQTPSIPRIAPRAALNTFLNSNPYTQPFKTFSSLGNVEEGISKGFTGAFKGLQSQPITMRDALLPTRTLPRIAEGFKAGLTGDETAFDFARRQTKERGFSPATALLAGVAAEVAVPSVSDIGRGTSKLSKSAIKGLKDTQLDNIYRRLLSKAEDAQKLGLDTFYKYNDTIDAIEKFGNKVNPIVKKEAVQLLRDIEGKTSKLPKPNVRAKLGFKAKPLAQTPEMYGGVAGFEKDEQGRIKFNPEKAALGVAGIAAINRGKGLKKLPKGIDELAQEARKYKSAEEFVNSRTVTLYHGTSSARGGDVISELNKGTYLTDNPAYAKLYSGDRGASGKPDVYKVEVPASAISKTDKPNEVVLNAPISIKNAEKLNYIDLANAEAGYTKSDILTRSELTEVYNRATNKAGRIFKDGFTNMPSQVARKGRISVPEGAFEEGFETLQTGVSRAARSLQSGAQELAQGMPGLTRQAPRVSTVAGDLVPPQGPGKPFSNIINDAPEITVKEKVGVLDYIRTPDRVLKKIGLGKESDFLRNQYTKYLEELPQEIDKVTQWASRVPGQESNVRIFRYLDGDKVTLNTEELKVAKEIQQYLSQWADRLGLPQDKRIASYITHIFDKDFIKKEFDPDLARIIRDKVAGSVYDPFLQKRLGKLGYVEDTWRALDAYVKRATRKANLDPALDQIKQASKSLEESQFDYVKKYIDRINLRPTRIDNMVDNSIKQMIGYRLGQRPTALLSRNVRQLTYRGALGLNFGSAVRNLTQGVNTYAKLGEEYTIKGYAKLAKKLVTNDLDELRRTGVLDNSFIQDRKISAVKKGLERMDKGLFFFFETAEKINRGAAYYGAKTKALSKGLSEEEAIKAALKTVRDTQFTFGAIDTPPILQSDIIKVLSQFQSFNVKQLEFVGELVSQKEWAGVARFLGANALIVALVGEALGIDYLDIIPFSGVVTGETKLGKTPIVNVVTGATRAAIKAPDRYGNVPEGNVIQRILSNKDFSSSAPSFLPGGQQIKKTYQGVQAATQGYSATPTGKARFPVQKGLPTFLQVALLGQYSGPAARAYFDLGLTPLGDKDTTQLRERVQAEEDPNRAFFDITVQRLDRSKKTEEEKLKIIDRLRKALKINEASAAEDAPLPQKVSAPTVSSSAVSSTSQGASLTADKMADLVKADNKSSLSLEDRRSRLLQQGIFFDGESYYDPFNDQLMYFKENRLQKVNLKEIADMPANTYLQKKKKEKETYKAVKAIVNSDLPDETIANRVNQIGVTPEEAVYYGVATMAADERAAFALDIATTSQNKVEDLVNLRRRVGGKQVLTDPVITDLVNEGVLTKEEGKYLKSIKFDKDGKLTRKTSGGRKKKGRKIKFGKIASAKAPPKIRSTSSGQTRRTRTVKLRLPQTKKARIPRPRKTETVEDFKKRLLAKR